MFFHNYSSCCDLVRKHLQQQQVILNNKVYLYSSIAEVGYFAYEKVFYPFIYLATLKKLTTSKIPIIA